MTALRITKPAFCVLVALTSFPGLARAGDARGSDDVSPARRVDRDTSRLRNPETRPPRDPATRSIDGSGNNLDGTEWNAVGTPLFRLMAPDYADGVEAMAGASRPGARLVSNLVCGQDQELPTPLATSDYLWQWGQFVDHDLDLTEGVDPPESAHIAVPAGDPFFDPSGSGTQLIFFNRSLYAATSGTDPTHPREQLNEISGWLDASNVYGSDPERASALRANDGTGRLRTSPGNLLPFNDAGLPNATGGSSEPMFLAGDVRANEQVGLTAMHTLFVREHNRLAERFAREAPRLSGDALYERARRIVGAELQAITYREFLPALLGPDSLAPYTGYDPTLDPRVANVFSTAAYRFGHSALSPTLLRLDSDLREIPAGHLALRDAFFDPRRITQEGGIEPLLRGLAHQVHQRIDVLVIDDVRNFLFGQPGQGGFDLAALNIQRGRDHGLPGYNAARRALGLPAAVRFEDVSSDPEVQARLASAYGDVEEVDLWVGGLAEDPLPGGQLGPLFARIVADQFEALRDGDRFWYEIALSPEDLREVEATRLSDVIRRNTRIGGEIPDDVFHVRERRRRR